MTDYFFHDVNASSDEKLQELRMEMKCQGIGIYWSLIELLKQNDGRMNYKPALLAYSIRGCTTEEVERVITGFNLFVVRDGQFWSPSLLRRIEMQEEATAKKTAAASKAGKASAKARGCSIEDSEDPDNSTDVQQPFNDRSAAVQPNKLINKLIDKSLSDACAGAPAHEREERERIFEKFFFRNFRDPAGEVERYLGNYAGQGWRTSKGQPITDRVAYCSGWKPQDERPRFARDALAWYQNFFKGAAPDIKDSARLLKDLLGIIGALDGRIILQYSDKDTAQGVADWCATHGGYAAVQVQVARKQPRNKDKQ